MPGTIIVTPWIRGRDRGNISTQREGEGHLTVDKVKANKVVLTSVIATVVEQKCIGLDCSESTFTQQNILYMQSINTCTEHCSMHKLSNLKLEIIWQHAREGDVETMSRLERWEKNEGVWSKGARSQVTGGRQALVGQVRTVDTSSPSLAQFTSQSTWPRHAYARQLAVTCCLVTLRTVGQVGYFTPVTCTRQNVSNELLV